MELDRFDNFYKIQSKFYDLTRPFFLISRKRALSSLKFNKNDKVLDLACGTGLNIKYISKLINSKNITGIDYSKSMLNIARKKYPNMHFIQGDVSKYNFKFKFDKIICAYSLSMIDEWQNTIRNVSKHLKKDGAFLILDFHPWRGFFKPIYQVFKKWLSIHGVDSDRNYIPILKKNLTKLKKQYLI